MATGADDGRSLAPDRDAGGGRPREALVELAHLRASVVAARAQADEADGALRECMRRQPAEGTLPPAAVSGAGLEAARAAAGRVEPGILPPAAPGPPPKRPLPGAERAAWRPLVPADALLRRSSALPSVRTWCSRRASPARVVCRRPPLTPAAVAVTPRRGLARGAWRRRRRLVG